MESIKKRHRKLFASAFMQGMGAGVFSLERHPISGLRSPCQPNSMRHDLEQIGNDFNAAIRQEKTRRATI
jgi:hypothetical protein